VTRRRHCLVATVLGPLLRPHPSVAQATQRIFRVGILRPGARPQSPSDLQLTGIPTALREMGYADGANLVIEQRWADGDLGRLPALAGELLQARVDLVVAVGAAAVRSMAQATATLPIVMFGNFDPLAMGLVTSLARPGSNVTGVVGAPDGTLAGKRLELLKSAVPQARRIGLLVPDDDSIKLQVQETRAAAQALGVELTVIAVRGGDYAGAFAALARERVAALVVGSHQYFVRDRQQIIDLAARHRLPAMYEWREIVADGGLMAYSTRLIELYQRVAWYVDRILKGAKPAEMPVEQPTRFTWVINRKTATALGLALTQSLLVRVDEVIE